MLKLLADPTRLRIARVLLRGEHPVSEFAAPLGVRQAAVSQRLAKLRWAGFVDAGRDGNRIFDRTVDDHIAQLVAKAFSHAPHVHPDTVTTTAHVGDLMSVLCR